MKPRAPQGCSYEGALALSLSSFICGILLPAGGPMAAMFWVEMLLGNPRPTVLRRRAAQGGPGGGGPSGPGFCSSGRAHVQMRGRSRPRGGGQHGAAVKAVPARRLRPASGVVSG